MKAHAVANTPIASQPSKEHLKRILEAACNAYAPTDSKCVCINAAIFQQDSQWMKPNPKSVGYKANNPCNVRPMGDNSPIPHTIYNAPGNGKFAMFESQEDGIYACVDLYVRKYRGKDPQTIVSVWAQTKSANYHNAVADCF